MVGTLLGLALDACQIGASTGLRHGHGQNHVTAHGAGQKSLALFFVAKVLEVRPHDAVVQREVDAGVAPAQNFFGQDLVIPKISDARAAVSFVGPHAQQALRACLLPHLAVNTTGFAPTLDMRRYLVFHEAHHAVAKGVMVSIKDCAVHGVVGWRDERVCRSRRRDACGLAKVASVANACVANTANIASIVRR